MTTLKQMAMTPALTELVQTMCPPDKPDARGVEYDFSKCPSELRGEVIVSMARVDGFVIGLEGDSNITMHTNGDDIEMGDRWFDVIMAYHHAVLWYLFCQSQPKTLH